MQCSFPLQIYLFTDCRVIFTFRGRKGTLHAGVVKSCKQSGKKGGAENTVTSFRQEEAQDSSSTMQ